MRSRLHRIRDGSAPKTAKTVVDNFRLHIFPVIGAWNADKVTRVHLERLYRNLEQETGLAPTVILCCHEPAWDPWRLHTLEARMESWTRSDHRHRSGTRQN